jgi:hypothetical protein
MDEPRRNACRVVPGRFPDGQQKYIWTLASGAGLFHSHDKGTCPLGFFGKTDPEELARGLAGETCPCCNEPVAMADLMGGK